MKEQIFEYLKEQNYENAASLASKCTCEELAAILRETQKQDIPAFCRALPSDTLAEALVLLVSDLQEDVINGLREDELNKVLDMTSEEISNLTE